MKLKRVVLDRFKGRSVVWEPAALEILYGPNGSGKSARLQAVVFAIEGRVPSGRVASELAKYVSPTGGGVDLVFEDGFSIGRHIVIDNAERKVEQRLTINGKVTPKAKAEKRIAEHLSPGIATLDVSDFLSMSADAKRAFVVDLCKASSTVGTDPREFDADIIRSCSDAGIDDLDAIGAVCRAINPAGASRLDLDAAVAILDRASDLVKETTSDAERAEAAIQRLADRQADIAAPASSVEQLRATVADARKRIEDGERRLGEFQGAARAVKTYRDELEQLERRAGEIEDTLAEDEPDDERRVAELRAAANAHRKDAERLDVPDKAVEAIDAAIDKLRRDRQALTDRDNLIAGRLTGLHVEESAGRSQRASIVGSDWFKLKTLLTDQRSHVELETVGGGPWFAEVVAFVDARCGTSEGLDAIDRQLADVKASRERLTAERDTIKAEAEPIARKLDAAFVERESVGDARRDAAKARKMADDEDREADRLERRVAEHAGRLDALRDELERNERRREELDELIRSAGSVCPNEEINARTVIDKARADLQAAEAGIKQRGDADALARELAVTRGAAEAARIKNRIARIAAEAARKVREAHVGAITAPLVSALRDLLPYDWEPFCDLETRRGKRDFVLGAVIDDKRRPLDSMSGGESAVFCGCLALAIVSLSDQPFKFVAIEAGEIDEDNLAMIAETLGSVAATSERLGLTVADHIVIATPADVRPMAEGDGSNFDAWDIVDARTGIAVIA